MRPRRPLLQRGRAVVAGVAAERVEVLPAVVVRVVAAALRVAAVREVVAERVVAVEQLAAGLPARRRAPHPADAVARADPAAALQAVADKVDAVAAALRQPCRSARSPRVFSLSRAATACSPSSSRTISCWSMRHPATPRRSSPQRK